MKERLVCLFLLIAFASSAQKNNVITVNGNLRVRGNSNQGMFPIMSFDDGLRIGGLGLGFAHFIEWTEKYDLKLSANLTRQAYWSEPIRFNKGPNVVDLVGYSNPVTGELYAGFFGIGHRKLPGKFSVGTGLGFELLLVSVKVIEDGSTSRNRQYQPIMPVIPMEISWKGDMMLYNIHGELGLINRNRGELRKYEREKFFLIAFEVGLRI